MKLEDVINERYLDSKSLNSSFAAALPFAHIVMENFLRTDLAKAVADEFPDARTLKKNSLETNRSSKGMGVLSPTAVHLTAYMQSDLMLDWLGDLTGISEPLISDPYLVGGGYHESRKGDVLKVHADFNKHPSLDLDRRINFLIYLNENWEDDWGGAIQLFDRSIKPVQTVSPRLNTAVIFATTSHTYHGFPDPIDCPENRSRRSLAYYYFSNGRPKQELSLGGHSTLWKEREGEKFENNTSLSASEKFKNNITLESLARDCTPPILLKGVKRLLGK